MTARIRLCRTSIAAVPIRGEITARMLRVRLAIHRAEAEGDGVGADAARVALLALGSLLARLTATMERHRDLHPHETESELELAELWAALGPILAPEPADVPGQEAATRSATLAVDSRG